MKVSTRSGIDSSDRIDCTILVDSDTVHYSLCHVEHTRSLLILV